MKIHVLCTKEELGKIDEIQEALSRAMKPLSDLGLKGEITIEEDWKCPACGERSIDGMAVEHKDGCTYCAERVEKMLKAEE